LAKINETFVDKSCRPLIDVRINHTIVLDDPFEDPDGFAAPSRSPTPDRERLFGANTRIGADEIIDDDEELDNEEIKQRDEILAAEHRANLLTMIGDLPDENATPDRNVLFVCKLNPVTTDEDLELIFSRFGEIKMCEIIRDKRTEASLQYAFIEFDTDESCERAYFKMDNVLIDDRRIHVDFSQSVAKQWRQWKFGGKMRNANEVYDREFKKEFTDKNSRSSGANQRRNRPDKPRADDRRRKRDHSADHDRKRRNYSPDRSKRKRSRERRRSRERKRSRSRDRK
jgi:peptidyl-prolyl cis-trans isomerase-like 4